MEGIQEGEAGGVLLSARYMSMFQNYLHLKTMRTIFSKSSLLSHYLTSKKSYEEEFSLLKENISASY